MLSHPWKTLISAAFLCLFFAVPSPVLAQYGFEGVPGYPFAFQEANGSFSTPFGWSGYTSNSAGLSGLGSVGFGFVGSSGTFSGSGQFGASIEPNGLPCVQGCSAAGPQAQITFQPTLGLITAVPGWNGTSHRTRRRTAPRPSARITSAIDGIGKNTTPSALAKNPIVTPIR